MNTELQTQLAQILQALQTAATKYGPQALDLAFEVRRWDAVGRLSTGFVMLLAAYLVVRFTLKLYRREMAAFEVAKERSSYLDPILPYVILTFGGLFALGLIWEGLTRALYVWHWVALVRPELAFAHDVLLKVGLAR